MRILILNKTSCLYTTRHGFDVYAGIDARRRNPLERARSELKGQIASIRYELRERTHVERKYKSHTYYLVGGTFTQENSILNLIRQKKTRARGRKLRVLEQAKKPRNYQQHVGVEIEFFTRTHDGEDIKRLLADADLERFCNLTTDGSVHADRDGSSDECDGSCRDGCECACCGETHHCDNEDEHHQRNRNFGDNADWEIRDNCDCGGEEEFDCGDGTTETRTVCDGHCEGHSCAGYDDHENYECQCECNCGPTGRELRIIAPQKQIRDVIRRVCAVLSQCKAEVNDTCGLHVHLDMRKRNVAKAYNNLVAMQNTLYRMVPKSRKNNSFCRPTKERDWSVRDRENRYQGVNPLAYSRHKTLEVRIHSGTVNADKINHWIDLLIATVRAPLMKTAPSSVSHALNVVKAPEPLREYVKSRVEKFKPEHVQAA